jgi:hypothetical protein
VGCRTKTISVCRSDCISLVSSDRKELWSTATTPLGRILIVPVYLIIQSLNNKILFSVIFLLSSVNLTPQYIESAYRWATWVSLKHWDPAIILREIWRNQSVRDLAGSVYGQCKDYVNDSLGSLTIFLAKLATFPRETLYPHSKLTTEC